MAVMLPTIAQTQPRPVPDITDCTWPLQDDVNFCRSPTMQAAEAEVARLAAAARTPGPVWWSVTADQEIWRAGHRNPQASVNDLHHAYALRAMELKEVASGIRRTLEMKVSLDELAANCLVPAHLGFESFARICSNRGSCGSSLMGRSRNSVAHPARPTPARAPSGGRRCMQGGRAP
jgi:hypothetical protein